MANGKFRNLLSGGLTYQLASQDFGIFGPGKIAVKSGGKTAKWQSVIFRFLNPDNPFTFHTLLYDRFPSITLMIVMIMLCVVSVVDKHPVCGISQINKLIIIPFPPSLPFLFGKILN